MKLTSMSAEELGTLLGISEASAYDLIAKGHFERIEVLGKMRISNESFWKWYSTQSIYRTVEDQAKDAEKNGIYITYAGDCQNAWNPSKSGLQHRKKR